MFVLTSPTPPVTHNRYYVMMLSFVFLNPDREHSEDDLQSAIFCFGMSNSVVNPIVYGLFHLWPMRARERRSTDRLTATAGGTTITTRCSFTKYVFCGGG